MAARDTRHPSSCRGHVTRVCRRAQEPKFRVGEKKIQETWSGTSSSTFLRRGCLFRVVASAGGLIENFDPDPPPPSPAETCLMVCVTFDRLQPIAVTTVAQPQSSAGSTQEYDLMFVLHFVLLYSQTNGRSSGQFLSSTRVLHLSSSTSITLSSSSVQSEGPPTHDSLVYRRILGGFPTLETQGLITTSSTRTQGMMRRSSGSDVLFLEYCRPALHLPYELRDPMELPASCPAC